MNLDYRNIGKLLSLNVVNAILNIISSTLMVYFFGTSSQVEAYFTASILGTAVSRFVQTGQLVEIIIPVYYRTKQQHGLRAAMSIVATLCNFMVGIAIIMVIVFIVGNEWVIRWLVPGFDKATQKQVLDIFYWTGFLMPIQIATNLFQGILSAEKVYGKAEFTNTISLLVTILILVIGGRNGNVYSLVVGVIFSVLTQFITVLYYLSKLGYRHYWQLKNPYFSLRQLLKAVSATSSYMIGVQVYTFVFNAALSLLPAGTFAIYRYVEIIYGKISTIFMLPIGTVFFTDINHFMAQDRNDLVKTHVSKNLNLSYFISLLIFLPFWAGGAYFVWMLWGGEKFDANAVHKVYYLLCVFLLGLTLLGPYMIFRKLVISTSRADLQYYMWTIMHLVSAGIGYELITWLGFNGIAMQVLSHSILISSIPLLTIYLSKREFLGWYSMRELLKITVALVFALAVGFGLHSFWKDFIFYTKIESGLISSVLAIVTVCIFIGVCLLLKVTELSLIKKKLINKFI